MSFDDLLNKRATVMRPATSGAKDGHGNLSTAPAAIATNVPCRLSYKVGARAREYKSEKKAAVSNVTVFMRVRDLTEKDVLIVDGKTLNILDVSGPGGQGHHLEVLCEELKP